MATPLAEARTRQFPTQHQAAPAQLPATFDLDAFHAMQARDDQLVAQRAAHGVVGQIFVYKLAISGVQQSGISVEGAHQLATIYGGIKHRIVATSEKRGAVFTFKSYPSADVPMSVSAHVVPELAGEDDFYSITVEVTDVKSGNTFQVEKSETRMEQRRDGTLYERPNFQIIAQSKARRNAILTVIPGDVQEQFKARCLQAGQSIDIGADVFRTKHDGIVKFAAAKGISIDRRAIQQLTLEQISGLGEAARSEDLDAFREALEGLGVASAAEGAFAPEPTVDEFREAHEKAVQGLAEQLGQPKRRGRPPGSSNRPKAPTALDQPSQGETVDEETGEVTTDEDQPGRSQMPFEE